MDPVDPAITEIATQTLLDTTGVVDVEYMRLRWLGHRLTADAAVVVDANLDLLTAHGIAHAAEQHLVTNVGKLSQATIHVSPADTHGNATPSTTDVSASPRHHIAGTSRLNTNHGPDTNSHQ